MKLKNKTRLLNELAKEADNPKDFIRYVMALQQQSAEDVSKEAGITRAHFHVTMNQITKGNSIGTTVCAKLAKGLDIDPYALYRVIADHAMRVYLEKQKSNN